MILAGIGLALLSQLLANEANYVLYRFTAHFASDRGLNYQIPDSTLTIYPLVPILLSLFAYIGLPIGIWLLCAVSIAAGALFIERLTASRWVAGISYILASLIYPSPVILIMVALVLAGLDAVRYQRWLLGGVLMGLAITAQPLALIPAVLLILFILRTVNAVWRYLLPAFFIPAFALALTRLSFGTSDVIFVSILPEIITDVLPILAIVVLVRKRTELRDKPILGVLVAWGAVAACLALLRGTWPTAVIIPGAIALVATSSMRFLTVVAAAVDLTLNLVLPNPSANTANGHSLGTWIATHTSPETTVATADIGSLAYYADRPLIDLSGKLQSNPFDKDFFLRSAPDVIVLEENTQVPWQGFKTTYAPVYSISGETVYQRVVNFSAPQVHHVDIDFSANLDRNDLRLTNIGIADIVHPSEFVRIRLDWQLNSSSSREKVVKVLLNTEDEKTVVTALDKYPAEAWTLGENITYHLLMLPDNLPIGHYSIYIDVTVNNGDLGPYKIIDIDVTK